MLKLFIQDMFTIVFHTILTLWVRRVCAGESTQGKTVTKLFFLINYLKSRLRSLKLFSTIMSHTPATVSTRHYVFKDIEEIRGSLEFIQPVLCLVQYSTLTGRLHARPLHKEGNEKQSKAGPSAWSGFHFTWFGSTSVTFSVKQR